MIVIVSVQVKMFDVIVSVQVGIRTPNPNRNPQNPQIYTQTIEGLWSRLKRFLRSKNSINKDYLEHYVPEFVFLRNNKNLNSIDLAIKLVELINEL